MASEHFKVPVHVEIDVMVMVDEIHHLRNQVESYRKSEAGAEERCRTLSQMLEEQKALSARLEQRVDEYGVLVQDLEARAKEDQRALAVEVTRRESAESEVRRLLEIQSSGPRFHSGGPVSGHPNDPVAAILRGEQVVAKRELDDMRDRVEAANESARSSEVKAREWYNAYLEVVRQRDDAKRELEQVRRFTGEQVDELRRARAIVGTARICGQHVGRPQETCPVCDVLRLRRHLDHATSDRDKHATALVQAQQEIEHLKKLTSMAHVEINDRKREIEQVRSQSHAQLRDDLKSIRGHIARCVEALRAIATAHSGKIGGPCGPIGSLAKRVADDVELGRDPNACELIPSGETLREQTDVITDALAAGYGGGTKVREDRSRCIAALRLLDEGNLDATARMSLVRKTLEEVDPVGSINRQFKRPIPPLRSGPSIILGSVVEGTQGVDPEVDCV